MRRSKRRTRILDEKEYLNSERLARMMTTLRRAWKSRNGDFLGLRDAFMTELGLSTGLRVEEMADLSCEDLQISGRERSVVVRKGKGSKRRVVRISERFKERCAVFIEAKGKAGEPTEPAAPVFYSPVTGKALTRRALQKAFKRVAKTAGLGREFSIHCLRHTYGTRLTRVCGKYLPLVQRQMGHDSIETTAVYLHVEDSELDEAVEELSRQLGSTHRTNGALRAQPRHTPEERRNCGGRT